jgi:hypothetical protein
MAIIGGILYSGLTYAILIPLDLSSELTISASIIVFLFYLGSRFLILFSGVDSSYYSSVKRGSPKRLIENNYFYQTTQWVGKFYHYHDIVLFIFLTFLSIAFMISLIRDWLGHRPLGSTIQSIRDALTFSLNSISSFLLAFLNRSFID